MVKIGDVVVFQSDHYWYRDEYKIPNRFTVLDTHANSRGGYVYSGVGWVKTERVELVSGPW